MPANFAPVVYVVQRTQQPAQIWILQYEQNLLQQDLLINLTFSELGSKIGSNYDHIGYLWVDNLTLSPDGSYVGITLMDLDHYSGIALIISSDGEVYLPLVSGSGGEILDWIPGTERVIIKGSMGANWGTVNFDGSDYVPFPTSFVVEAVAHPDGKKIIFSKTPTQNIWIGSIDVDGQNLTPFSLPKPLPGLRARNLTLSPDGQSCAFIWDRELAYCGAGQIWLMDLDGSNQRPLGPDDTYDHDLAWAPDGRTIVFVRWEDPGDHDVSYDPAVLIGSLLLIDIESAEEQQLVSSEEQYSHWSPRWLPDGSGLVFLSNMSGETNLWFIRPDGSGLQQLSQQGGLVGNISVLTR